jgi:hypothetical protein
MATEEQIEEAADEIKEFLDEIIDDTERFSQAESVEVLDLVASHCRMRMNLIRDEMA